MSMKRWFALFMIVVFGATYFLFFYKDLESAEGQLEDGSNIQGLGTVEDLESVEAEKPKNIQKIPTH